MFCIVLVIIVLSLLCCLLVHYPYKRAYPKSGKAILEHINKHYEEYVNGEDFLDQKIKDIDEPLKYIKESNEGRKKCIINCLCIFSAFDSIFFYICYIIVE